MSTRFPVFPLDIDAIENRARSAPGGQWAACMDRLWIPWSASTDDEPCGPWSSGRLIGIEEGPWHCGSENPPPELWEFLAASRDDVLSLVAEVRRLRARLDSTAQKAAA